jgi:hypothetical protein
MARSSVATISIVVLLHLSFTLTMMFEDAYGFAFAKDVKSVEIVGNNALIML